MDEEIAPILANMSSKETLERSIAKFFFNDQLVVVKCGIGKVNAAACTQALIDKFACDAIINVGIAGAIGQSIKIGDVVVATDLIEHDFDASGIGLKRGEIPRMDTSTFTCDPALVELASRVCNQVLNESNVHLGRIVSGDEFVSSKEKKIFLRSTFKGLAAEMEGAAIAHVCHINRVPFVVIRAMSDSADDNANEDYCDNDISSIDNTAKVLLKVLQSYLD